MFIYLNYAWEHAHRRTGFATHKLKFLAWINYMEAIVNFEFIKLCRVFLSYMANKVASYKNVKNSGCKCYRCQYFSRGTVVLHPWDLLLYYCCYTLGKRQYIIRKPSLFCIWQTILFEWCWIYTYEFSSLYYDKCNSDRKYICNACCFMSQGSERYFSLSTIFKHH